MAAKQYYVEYQTDIATDRLLKLIPTYIPDSFLQAQKAIDKWSHLIITTLQKVIYCIYCIFAIFTYHLWKPLDINK